MEGKEAVTEKQDTEEENAKESGKKGTKESNPSKAKTNSKTGDKSVRSTKMTAAEAQDAYAEKSLDDDEVYSYDFMTRLPDMNVVELPSASSIQGDNNRINKADVVSEGMKNARSVGTERDGNAYVVTVKNRYTGRDIQVTSNAIRHGLNGSYARMATNAKLGSRVGTLIQNAVPVNALNNTAKSGNVTGTYAMAALTTDSEGRQVVAVITVEQRSNTVTGIESYDVAHALNGRKTGSPKAAGGSQADSKSQVLNLIKTAKISVPDFLNVVKDTHRSILSEDVLHHLNLERPVDGYYTDRVRYSTDADKAESVETEKTEHSESKISADSSASDSEKAGENGAKAESSESKSDTSDTSKDTKSDTLDTGKDAKTAPVENSPAPSGKYDESHPNKIAQWMAKETSVAIKALGVDNAEISIDYNMDRASNGYYLVKDGKRQIVLNGQLGGTTREGQVYSAQQNIRYVLGHELGHLVQGVGYTGDTNTYTRDILSVYQQNTGTTAKQVEAGVRDIMVRYMDEADRADSKLNISREDVTLDYAKGEYAANCLAEMLGDYNTLRKIARGQNRNIVQKAIDRVAKFRSEIIAERRKRSIAEAENSQETKVSDFMFRAKEKLKGSDVVGRERVEINRDGLSNVNGNVNDWFMIANLYDEAAENLEETLREAMKNAGKMRIAEENSAPRASITDNEKSNTANQDAGASEGEAVSSIRKETQAEITKKYGKSVDNILAGKYGSQDNVLMGYTPNILQKLGVPDLPVVIGPGHVYSIAKTEAEAQADGRFRKGTNYHGMGEQTVKSLYEKLESPIAVIASKDIDTKRFPVRSQRSVVEIIDIGSKNKSLLAAVEITVDRRVQGTTMDVNVLSSAYERNAAGLLQEAIAQENSGDIGVFYIKKETAGMVADKGTIPNGTYHASVSGTILHQIPEKVNLRIQNQTQTKQFADWFGDWQNNPSRASKVVNEDGTPKVVYHGTNADFSIFQSKDGTYWFSEDKDYAEAMAEERGGTRVEGYYLNLRNPYRATLPANQFSNPNYEAAIIRKAKAGGYDGAIIQNDTDSEYAKDTFYVTFSPNQIKSAEYNVGTFDKNNPDIRYSLSDDTDDTDETDLPGWDEDNHSKFDQFTDTYEKGTNLIGKSKSIQAATALKREYGSNANTQSIAAKYRQMTTIAEQFSNVYLDGMMGEELLGKENRTRTYEDTQLPTSNRAAVFHRLVIARAGCTAQKRQSIRTTAFQ